MKFLNTLFLASLLVLLVFSPFNTVAQEVPKLLNYQGKLTDSSGKPLPDGPYGLSIRIWPNAMRTSQESLIWGQEYANVPLVNGSFNLILGNGTALPTENPLESDLGNAFNETNRFFGISITRGTNGLPVAGATEILPRQQILSVPFAISAHTAATVALDAVGETNLTQALREKIQEGTRSVGNPAAVGGVAMASLNNLSSYYPRNYYDTNSVTLKTQGNPVIVRLVHDTSRSGPSLIQVGRPENLRPAVRVYIVREQAQGNVVVVTDMAITGSAGYLPIAPSSVMGLDTPPAGESTYKFGLEDTADPRTEVSLQNLRLIAYELQ